MEKTIYVNKRELLEAYENWLIEGHRGQDIDQFLASLPPQGSSVSERAVEERAMLWGCYMEGTDEKGISDDILLSVHSTPAGAHENSMRMQKEYGGKHYTDKVVIHA